MRPESVQWKPNPLCGKPHDLWTAPDTEATETEVTAFVAALVSVIKAALVVETGTYQGHTTRAIAAALPPQGVLHTFDLNPVEINHVSVRAHTCRLQDGPDLQDVELAFLDSSLEAREGELDWLMPRLTPGAFVIIHDAAPNRPPGAIAPVGWARFQFGTPRGLIVLQKPWEVP